MYEKRFSIVGLIIAKTFLIVSCGNDTFNSTATATAGAFKSPSSIMTEGTNLYIADTGSNTIRLLIIYTGETSTLAGSSAGSAGSSDGTGASAFSGLRT